MAVFSPKYLTFTKQAGTGTQTISGVGFRGKALLLWSSYQTAAGTTTGVDCSLGITDGILQSVRSISHPGGEATTTSGQSERTNRIAWKTNATSGSTPTVLVEGEFAGFTSDGFTINWVINDGAATIYHALVLGGDIDAVFTQVKIDIGVDEIKSVTGIGFKPNSFIVMGGAADEFGTGDYNAGAEFGSLHGYGFSNASENVCGWTLGRGTGGAADNYRGQHTDRVSSVRVANNPGAGEMMGMRITSADADGFTLTRDAIDGSANEPVQHILCLKGVRFALGTFDTPGSTGDMNLPLPFEPQLLMLQTLGTAASTNTSGMGLAVGAWDGTYQGGIWIGGVDASNPSVYRRATYADLVLQSRAASTGTVDLEAEVTAADVDGATINFATVPASANAVLYMAMAATATIRDVTIIGTKTDVRGASRAVAVGLDGNDNVLTESGKMKVFGDFEVTGTATFPALDVALDDLSDVVITTPSVDDVLTYDGSDWVNGPSPGGGGGSADGGALILLEEQIASASSQLDFTAAITSLYDQYVIVGDGLVLSSSGADLQILIGTGGGPTYDTGNNYEWTSQGRSTAATGEDDAGSTGMARVFKSMGNTAGWAGQFWLVATSLNSTSLRKTIQGDTYFINSTPRAIKSHFGMQWVTTGTAATAIRFKPSTGTITLGVIRIYALKKTISGMTQTAEVSLSSADILALRATPKTLVAAPGAGLLNEFVSAVLLLDATATAYVESSANLAVRYENGSGAKVSEDIEATGFIDQTADTMTRARPKLDPIIAKSGSENKALVLHNLGAGEYTTGTGTMRVKVTYRTWTTGW